jgi:aryl carrier-like protein
MKNQNLEEMIKRFNTIRIELSEILNKIETTLSEERLISTGLDVISVIEKDDETFSVGDRVFIRNLVRKPPSIINTWDKIKAQYATVTFVSFERVEITTDNNVKTWRKPKNLALVG